MNAAKISTLTFTLILLSCFAGASNAGTDNAGNPNSNSYNLIDDQTTLNPKEARTANTKPKTLIDIYNKAIANDPTLASALSANKAAQELIEQGKALYRPTVNFNAGVTATKTALNLIM